MLQLQELWPVQLPSVSQLNPLLWNTILFGVTTNFHSSEGIRKHHYHHLVFISSFWEPVHFLTLTTLDRTTPTRKMMQIMMPRKRRFRWCHQWMTQTLMTSKVSLMTTTLTTWERIFKAYFWTPVNQVSYHFQFSLTLLQRGILGFDSLAGHIKDFKLISTTDDKTEIYRLLSFFALCLPIFPWGSLFIIFLFFLCNWYCCVRTGKMISISVQN